MMFVVKDYLIVNGDLHLERPSAADAHNRKQFTYEGTSSIQLSQDFVSWQSQGVPLIYIPSISLINLEPGLYKVVVSTSNGLTNTVAGPHEYVHKVIYYGLIIVDAEAYRSALSYNTLNYPISMNPNQHSFSLTVKIEGITVQQQQKHQCSNTVSSTSSADAPLIRSG